MFYYVDGTVSVLQQGLAVIDCGGVGYACHASQNTIGKLKTGEKARLLTWLNVREGVFELYGFIDEEEKSCFLMLTSVNGVGPKAALSILSVAPPDRLALSIITGDEKNAHAGAGHRQEDRTAHCTRAARQDEQGAAGDRICSVSGGGSLPFPAVSTTRRRQSRRLWCSAIRRQRRCTQWRVWMLPAWRRTRLYRQCLKKLVRS